MAHRQLTLKQQLKGVIAALKSPTTPKQLRKGLEKRAKKLQKQIKKSSLLGFGFLDWIMRQEVTALPSVTTTTKQLCLMGKRNAVGNKSRSTVANSALVLRRPTSPPTAGRKPAASPPFTSGVGVGVGVGVGLGFDVDLGFGVDLDLGAGVDVLGSQLKSWALQSNSRNALSAPASQLSDADISELRTFFELLDQWERRRVEWDQKRNRATFAIALQTVL